VRGAQAKGQNEGIVSTRLRCAALPTAVFDVFFKHDFLKEDHARELLKSLNFKDLAPWLTHDQVLCKIVEGVMECCRISLETQGSMSCAGKKRR
jgi:hypothetical protein